MSLTEQIAYIKKFFPEAVQQEAFEDALHLRLPEFDDNDEVIARD